MTGLPEARRAWALAPWRGCRRRRQCQTTWRLFPNPWIRDKTVGDVALLFGFDEVADVVAFLENLPGDVTDETGERNKEKFTFVHFEKSQALTGNEVMMALYRKERQAIVKAG